jgi:hypothetical protein
MTPKPIKPIWESGACIGTPVVDCDSLDSLKTQKLNLFIINFKNNLFFN